MASLSDRPRRAPLDLSHHFSRSVKSRQQSSIKDFYKFFAIPGIGNLAGGLPNQSLFPYDTLEAAVALPQRFTPTPNYPSGSSLPTDPAATRLLVPKISGKDDVLRKIDLTTALQYGTAQGYPPLHNFLRDFTRENLNPNVPYAGGPEIILTCGNTDGFAKTLETFSNEWSELRDWKRDRQGLLVEEFAYMNAIQAAQPRGLQIVPVGMDGEGMRADGKGGLEDVLSNWDEENGKRPHIMYTVTLGQNPTSGTLSVGRRKDLYQICQKYDVVIIEDEPYWYLQYPSAVTSEEARDAGTVHHTGAVPGVVDETKKSSGFDFLDSLVPSYLSIDTDGRVVRLDTFSKMVAPGCRCGWITAQPAVVERILRISEVSTQQPSGFTQSMLAELLIGPSDDTDDGGRGGDKDGKGWGVEGWVRWLEGLRGEYERRMQTMCSILEEGRFLMKSTSKDVEPASGPSEAMTHWSVVDKVMMFDFVWPRAGMFVWVELNLSTHPLYHKMSKVKLSHALWLHLTTKPYLVLVAPASIFCPTPEVLKTRGPDFFRLCFAAVEEEEVKSTSHRFVAAFNNFWAKTDVQEMEDNLQVAAEEGCAQM
ncbi:MAG: hypothetical protein M1838_000576 [Thelocarpon superellum]|nr:MAG: hypothetical protein M1838_000576 [Thelocarpon superellum]